MDESESSLEDGSYKLSFLFLRRFFFLLRFFFSDDDSGDDIFDDESDNDCSVSGLSGMCPFSFSENSVSRVSGLFSFSQVIGTFHLVESLEFFI